MTVPVRALFLAAALVSPFAAADQIPKGPDIVLDELFGEGADARPSAPEPAWRPGHRTVVWIDDGAASGPRLMEFDPVSGDRRVLVDGAKWTAAWPDEKTQAPTLVEPVWRPDGNAFLITGDPGSAIYDITDGSLDIIAVGTGDEEYPEFSPDGTRIAWVRDNDLWVYDTVKKTEIRLTDDGSDTVFNGVFDWIYEEELAHRNGKAYTWSANGEAIVWLRLDDGEIPVFHLVDLMETHSKITRQRYPKPGDPMPLPSLHVAVFGEDSEFSLRRKWVPSGPTPYIPRFGFDSDGDLWYQRLERDQEVLELVVAGLHGNSETSLVIERDPHWIKPVDGLHFLGDGSFLWLSRISGHMHLYRVTPDKERIDLTPGEWDVTELVGTDPAGRFAWFQAARPGPLERHLFRVDLTTQEVVEFTRSPGTHSAELHPTEERLLVKSSSLRTPPRWAVVNSVGAAAAEVPVEHPIPSIDYADHRFVQVAAEDGLILNAMLLFPPDFDESRRHPVVVYTYGGPNAQVVTDSWPRTSGLFNHALAARGFVVFALDNRGSGARGRDFEGATDLALGSKQLPDQLAGVTWLKNKPWVDPDRIGIWGWSYGGYMTTFALTHAPDAFAAGAAVAPVTDWRLYDSIYTERYMGTPASNPEGYAAGSVLDAVSELDDPLLVIHGTGDDNVHLQHTMQFADQAWREGKRFDLVLFPNLAHGINASGSHLQVFSAIADFFEEHLMSGGDS